MKLNEKELQTLRNISIKAILGRRDDGRNILIKCPFAGHKDSTPSCSISKDNVFNCFGCGKKGGGAIDFLIALGYNFKEVINELKKYI